MKKEKIYNYFYTVNNLLNGHFYLGIHSTDNLAGGYMGSGKNIIAAEKELGIENFELVPLKFFKTRQELKDYEKEVVNKKFLEYYKDICYNIIPGGGGQCNAKRFTADELKEHHKKTDQKWRAENPEKAKESQYKANHKYYESNKESILEEHRNYYQENKETIREKRRIYNQANRERIVQYNRELLQRKKAERLTTENT